jgi:hypothetical protein
MTLLVARQCRLLGAAGSLRRLPAAITTRAYAVDASPQLPFRIRKIADNGSGGPPTTKTSLSRAQEDGSRSTITPGSARVEARVNSVRQPPNQRRSKDYNLRATPRLQDCEIGSVDSAILVPASVTATVGVVARLTRRMLTCTDARALRGEDRISARRYRQWHRSRCVSRHAVFRIMAP